MNDPRSATRLLRPLGILVLFAGLAFSVSPLPAGSKTKEALRFAAEMAKRGNWREAAYRWRLADSQKPGNVNVLNNLAVASEALGERTEARGYYERAIAVAGHDPRIDDNYRRFDRAERLLHSSEAASGEADEDSNEPPASIATPGDKKGKSWRVTVGLPVPARLELEGTESLLVASFLAPDTILMDVNRELVRFLRSEFRKRTSLDVLDVTPVPAIPEQTIEALLANEEFWRYLAREHDADLIVSGIVSYDRQDASAFRDIDEVSERTGQKIRRSVFVEQEEFSYELDLFFIDGSSGKMLLRDKLRRRLLFRGTSNDPITAFFELSESIAGDILGIVTPRTRYDTRFVFRN